MQISLNYYSSRVCVPSKIEDFNLSVFSMKARINELKTLAKNISAKCECKLDCSKCNWNQKSNNDKCRCEYKNLKQDNACKKCFAL